MLTKLNIPKKINVGFQDRKGTYTGKLAYIIYTDNKGVLRKEKSWNDWRDQKITPKEFDNVPTSGFVLNKKVGDYGGWHGRMAAIRIYDPRDFEFEIKVDNLLFILEETSAIKGKGLEGEFVYSWDGADLVLLPVSSQEYKSSANFTELQTQKVTKTAIKEGCIYLTKDNKQVMYLGRHEYHELEFDYVGYGRQGVPKHSKQHVFVSIDGKSTYWPQTGFTKLASKIGDDPSPLFADEFEKFKNSAHGSEPTTELVGVPYKVAPPTDAKRWYSKSAFTKIGDQFYPVDLLNHSIEDPPKYTFAQGKRSVTVSDDYKVKIPSVPYEARDKTITTEDLEKMDLYKVYLKNVQGGLIPLVINPYEEADDFDDDDDYGY